MDGSKIMESHVLSRPGAERKARETRDANGRETILGRVERTLRMPDRALPDGRAEITDVLRDAAQRIGSKENQPPEETTLSGDRKRR